MATTYKERIQYIADICHLNKIPYLPIREVGGGWQIKFPWTSGDVSCNGMSYGCNNGLVESYRFPWDNGGITADTPIKMAEKIVNYYKSNS